MHSNIFLTLSAFAFSFLAGCNAVQVAKLEPAALIDNPSTSQQLDINGLKLFSDEYSIGAWSGSFKQSSSGISFLNAIERHKTKSSFTVNGPGFTSTVTAHCGARKAHNSLPIYSSKPSNGEFQCVFETVNSEKIRTEIGFLILEPASSGGIIDLSIDRGLAGTISIGTTQLTIKSEHKAGNALIASEKPLGYSLSLFEETIALIDVNTQSATLPVEIESEKFQAALLGILALVFFQDVRDGDALG